MNSNFTVDCLLEALGHMFTAEDFRRFEELAEAAALRRKERQMHIERINVVVDGLTDNQVEYVRCLLDELFTQGKGLAH